VAKIVAFERDHKEARLTAMEQQVAELGMASRATQLEYYDTMVR